MSLSNSPLLLATRLVLATTAAVTAVSFSAPAAAQEVCLTNSGATGSAADAGSLACGVFSNATEGGTAFGYDAQANNSASTAIGAYTNLDEFTGDPLTAGSFSTAVGYVANSTGYSATALGAKASASGDHAVSIGGWAVASNTGGIAIGGDDGGASTGALSTGYAAIAVGTDSEALQNGAIALGGDMNSDGLGAVADGVYALALGADSAAANAGAVAIGGQASAGGTDGVAIGNGASDAGFANSVALGAGSTSTAANQVHVGGRTIGGLAAGVALDDAVNLSQLQAVSGEVSAVQGTVATHTTQIATHSGQIATLQTQMAAIDNELGGLQSGIDTLFDLRKTDRREMRQGVAAAMAMAQAPMPSRPGGISYAVNGATFRGQKAVGGSLMYRLPTSSPMAISAGFSYAGGKDKGLRVGIAGEF